MQNHGDYVAVILLHVRESVQFFLQEAKSKTAPTQKTTQFSLAYNFVFAQRPKLLYALIILCNLQF
jgi:hypothetical protein